MSPAMTQVFPSSIFPSSYATSTNNKHPHNYGVLSRASSDNATKKLPEADAACFCQDTVALTVWKKSLLMNCNGFTVFDGKGNLVFRVDNYVASNRAEIVLMDAAGKPLFTIRRKRLSLGENWMICEGERTTDPKYCVRRQGNLLNSKNLVQVTTASSTSTTTSSSSSPKKNVVYEIEGSYAQRSVSVYDTMRRRVAEIKRKEGPGGVKLGVDVFSLLVSRPHMDTALAMAIVILLDQMFGSTSSYSYHTRRYSP